MDERKMHLINKIFGGNNIRVVWSKEEEKYYVSIVDVVGLLSESKNPQIYWRVLKKRLKDEGNEIVTNCNGLKSKNYDSNLKEEGGQLVTICHRLKLKAQDGKYRLTDVCDIKEMFRVIESIPSKNAEPIKQWLARLGSERIDETIDPSIALERALSNYRSKGYDEAWISKRIRTLQERKSLTDVWRENGIIEDIEFAILTNEIYKSWSGMTSGEYKEYKGLEKENLRDNMDSIELILTNLSEESTKRLAINKRPKGLKENIDVAKIGGLVAKVAKEKLEDNLGESIINNQKRIENK